MTTKKILFSIFLSFAFILFPLSFLLAARAALAQTPTPFLLNKRYCEPPANGVNWTITADCVMYENFNGPVDADMTLSGNTTMTLHGGKRLVWYPGKKITIAPGSSIIIQPGSKIEQKPLCVKTVCIGGDAQCVGGTYYALAKTATLPPEFGGGTVYLGIDQETPATQTSACSTIGAGYVNATLLGSRDYVSMGANTSTSVLASSYRYLLNLGMSITGINGGAKAVLAENQTVRINGDNFQVCKGVNCDDTGTYGNVYIEGNVGIGTTTPNGILNVVSTASNQLTLTDNNAYVDATARTVSIDFKAQNPNGVVIGQSANISAVLTPNTAVTVPQSYLTFSTKDNTLGYGERMRINAAGNVGIGSTGPTTKLDVVGNGKFSTTLTSAGSTTIGTGASSANTMGAGASSTNVIGSVTTPGALTLHGATTLDNTFTVSGANLTSLGGNLTVTGTAWTATPTISGLITATSGLTSNGTLDANGAVTLGDGGDDIAIDSNDWDISSAGALSGATTGNFSGTVTTPTISSAANLALSPVGTLTINPGSTTSILGGGALSINPGGTITLLGTGDITMTPSGDIIMNGSGNVGIGTTIPTTALDVVGTVNANDFTCADCIDAAAINTGAVGTLEIATDSIAAGDIAAGGVATSEILDGTIIAGDIATGAVTSTGILDNTVAAADIAPDAITASELATSAVTTTEILDNTVAAADIAPDAVADSELMNGGTWNLTSALNFAGNNIGIGTTTPDKLLEITAAASPGGTLRLKNTDTAINIGDSLGEIEFWSTDASANGNTIGASIVATALNAGNIYALDFNTLNSSSGLITQMTVHNTGVDVTGTGTFTSTLTANGALDANGAVTLGDGGDALTIASTGLDVSSAGAISGVIGITTSGGYTQSGIQANTFTGPITSAAITASGIITSTAGVDFHGSTVYLNLNSNFATDINTGTSTGAVTIGGGTATQTVAINSSDWDISTTGVLTGISGITTDGGYTQTGVSANTFTGTPTFSNATYSALFTGGNVGIGSATPATKLDVVGTSQFSSTLTANGTLDANGAVTLGDAGEAITTSSTTLSMTSSSTTAINSSDWDISTTGVLTGISGITTDGGYTQSGTTANAFTGTPTFSNATYSALFTGGNVGIGTTAPVSRLEVKDTYAGASTYPRGIVSTTDSADGGAATIAMWKARSGGTLSANDAIGNIIMVGHDGTSYNTTYGVRIISRATEAWTSTAHGTDLGIQTNPNGSGAVATRFYIAQNGNVGVGSYTYTSAPAYQLTVSTDSAGKPTTNTWTISSDKRIKKNIDNFTDGLNVLLKLEPRTYQYNGLGGPGYDDSDTHIGVIAQEVEPVAPYLVETRKGVIGGKEVNDFKNYQGHALPFIIVNAIKEQQKQLTDLANRISATANLVIAKLEAGLIETKKLIVDGVDILKKLNELTNKVNTQQKQIDDLKKDVQTLKAIIKSNQN